MRCPFSLYLLPLLLLVSCNGDSQPQRADPQIPGALQPREEDPSFGSSYSRGGYSDLVNDLYEDLVEQDAKLKNLEVQLRAVRKAQSDSAKAFNDFHANSTNYYQSAGKHVLEITDTNLRRQIEKQVAESERQYKSLQLKHESLLTQIGIASTRIANLHQALQVLRTLPVIEKYQRENLPPTAPLERLLQMQNAAIQETEALLKKP